MLDLLATAVSALGGAERPGQVKMAEAVARAIEAEEHLAVQAGTGTGKSLAYLVPAIRHAVSERKAVVVSTATIALQRQLVDRDLPRLSEALAPMLGRAPEFAILKGRRNYLCMHRLQTGAPDDDPDELFDPRTLSATGRHVQRLHEWADETETGDRDELVPGVNEQAWRQVSVTAKECLGATRCPYGTECFAELARARAGEADVVVTNHALLAIDALEEFQVLPEHDVVVIDEAHELVDRVTSVATDVLTAPGIATAARRCGRLVEDAISDRLAEAGENLGALLSAAPPGRIDTLPESLGLALAGVRDAAHACVTALGPRGKDSDDPDGAGARRAAFAALDDVHDTCVRLLEAFDGEHDVVWLEGAGDRRPAALRVAPLSVGGLLREKLFGDRTAVLTSATLALGGDFSNLARQWGLSADGKDWSGLDVGSPFDHPRSGILYVARHLPTPGRDGLPEAYLHEIAGLIEAAGGRTLGLFSSMRAARAASEALRERLGVPILCQGDDATGLLIKQFAEDEETCLFGTLSLWQGVDVPGPSLRLVVIDRIPFPRPDDPLLSARQRAVTAHGGNGFMSVAATHAALLLAQGAGRLLRSMDDKGVVAVLDPRLVTARYGSFLRASLPPFWDTTDPEVVKGALKRLSAVPA
ncbi:ATP-dependent DNA helicase [Bailinhaonella thermotolerans]|uniref:ATP-dependent helicase DinG n=1 Tax=Bailinhaonella thermotolerans TaxID=1070861 RepID=A0A3A4BTK2_9ACTN|nr:ATP-dependent DNA helicase [Bailinhaonella thermotolerans]RJL34626.1 ATP-dependent DNA helicase [Bailinhaonella thermotolerans]